MEHISTVLLYFFSDTHHLNYSNNNTLYQYILTVFKTLLYYNMFILLYYATGFIRSQTKV